MKYFVAAEMSSDPVVIAILNHLSELISTARRLFRFFSWYTLYPKIVKSISEENPSLFGYLRNVWSIDLNDVILAILSDS